MADLIIKIKGEGGQFLKEIDKIKGKTKSLESSLKSIGQASAIGFAAVAGSATVATKAFANYESALVGVSKTTNLSGVALQKFGADIQGLAGQMPITANELLNIAESAGQLGVKEADLLTFTETIAKLNTATADLKGEEAATQIARILTVTGEGTANVEQFANVIVALGNNFAATEGEIAAVATRVAQSTAVFDLGSTNVLGMSTALKALGVQAEVGGSVVGRGFQAIRKAIEEGGASLETLQAVTGMTGDQLKKTFQDDAQAVFNSFVNGLAQANKEGVSTSAILSKVGLSGVRVNQVFGALAKGSSTFNSALRLANEQAQSGAALNEEYAKFTETLNAQFQVLQNQMTRVAVAIGSQLAPVVQQMIGFFKSLADRMQDPAFANFVKNALLIGGALTGVVTALTAGAVAFVQISKAIQIATFATKAMSISVKGLVGATGIGLLLIIATEIFLNWNKIWPAMRGVFAAFVNNVSKLASGFGQLLKGVFTLDSDSINQGMKEINAAFEQGMTDFNDVKASKDAETQALERENRETQREIAVEEDAADLERQIENDAMKLEQKIVADQATVEAEVGFQEKLAQADANAKAKEKARREQARADRDMHELLTNESFIKFRNELIANEKAFNKMSEEEQNRHAAKRFRASQKLWLDEQSAADAARREQIESQRRHNNRRLKIQGEYNRTVTGLDESLNSNQVSEFKSANQELTKLQGSKNKELFEIGKAAAIANITIETARSAMAIFTGFSIIPIVGPILGAAGAAAAIAFGAEQIAEVSQTQFQGAQEGGVMVGGVQGRDSIPSLLAPGEIVAPARSFDEVVNAVADSRQRRTELENEGAPGGDFEGQEVGVTIGFDGEEASQVLTAQQVEDTALGVSRETVFEG